MGLCFRDLPDYHSHSSVCPTVSADELDTAVAWAGHHGELGEGGVRVMNLETARKYFKRNKKKAGRNGKGVAIETYSALEAYGRELELIKKEMGVLRELIGD